ncbi:hypothetical protein [Olleya namhaensis]|uniref:hypothetical protein n=1 Tax=Olleya namhaensis TaxID=1144750 RepID=UPI00232FCE4A|nr:hypothetical protein [Olleya namhaensis]
MKNRTLKISTFLVIAFLFSCSANKELIRKERTEFGDVKFYVENYLDLKDNNYKKSVLAKFKNSTYYSFYPNEIIKTKTKEKHLFHTLTFGEIASGLKQTEYFQELSKIDSLILSKGDKILDSLKWNNYKKSKGASGFITEVSR